MNSFTTMAETSQLKTALKSVLKPIIPKRLIDERSKFIRLGPAGITYARLRALDMIGTRQKRTPPNNARSFMFVCHGNIMRSPTAELLLKRALTTEKIVGIAVISSGIHATPGTEAHPRAQAAARALGLSLKNHRSKLITPEMVAATEVIFAMDFQNLAELMVQFPDAQSKFFLLSSYADEKQRYREIPDPYFGGEEETRICFSVLQKCVSNLVQNLQRSKNKVALNA